MNICLVGFMGSGKTSIGRLLAKRNNMEFADTDEMIVNEQGMSIPAIFEKYGEAHFRDLEHELVIRLSLENGLNNTVLSTGGGLVTFERNQEYLKKTGKVVYLKASAECIYERVKDDTNRPLLNTEDKLGKIKEMLSIREASYMKAADVIVVTDGLSKAEVAEKIENLCNNK